MAEGTDFRATEWQQEQLTQQQRLSAQQLLVVNLLQLNTQEIEERVRMEVNDNPALEEGHSDEEEFETGDEEDTYEDDDDTAELDGSSLGSTADVEADYDDDNDNSSDYSSGSQAMREEIPVDAGTSFFEQLTEQLGEQPLDERKQGIGMFLIGMLDDDGWLRQSIEELVEILAFKYYIDTDVAEVTEVLQCIQQFDPAGVGARDLQECLLLQIDRKEPSALVQLQRDIVTRCFDDFTNNRWERIASTLGVTREDADAALAELVKLNPHPGTSLSEAVGRGMQQIIPDFIMDSDDENAIPMLDSGGVPTLHVSSDFRRMLKEQSQSGTAAQKEAARFLQQKIDSAQSFIQAVNQRERTLNTIMKAIYILQKDFFLTGDESQLKPMILQDVEDISGYDISTVSRVSNSKYVQTPFGTYPLKFFFSNRRVKMGGEDSDIYLNVNDILDALQAIVASEDKAQPYSDEKLAELLAAKGFNVARRTVAKYRDHLSIPTARMRKK